ncbi:hypothetical protein Tco_0753304 [Tanacetum coccineum]
MCWLSLLAAVDKEKKRKHMVPSFLTMEESKLLTCKGVTNLYESFQWFSGMISGPHLQCPMAIGCEMTFSIRDDRDGTPYRETFSLMYNLVEFPILSVARMGMKCAGFGKTIDNTTRSGIHVPG